MLKKVFGLALLMGSVLLTGCLKSDDNKNNEPQEYVVTEGAYIVNSGDLANGKDGSLTYIDFSTGTAVNNVYPIGKNPSDVMVYGNKVYVVGCGSNTIYVLNKKTRTLIETINTVDEMGEEEGSEPFYATAYGSNAYVSTHGGYVAVIDTASLTITKKYKVGSYPEGMGIGVTDNGTTREATLYVTNSDNGNGEGSISKINLSSGSVTEIKNDLIKNPRSVVVGGSSAFVLDLGYIDAEGNQKDNGVYFISSEGKVSKLIDKATGMSAGGQSIITYNHPVGSSTVDYKVYNLYYNSLSTFGLSGDDAKPITKPLAISIDPNTGYLMISSPGYVNMYDGNGYLYKSFDAGENPVGTCYSYGTAIYKQ